MTSLTATLVIAAFVATAVTGNMLLGADPNANQPVFNVGNIGATPSGSPSIAGISDILGTLGGPSQNSLSMEGGGGLGGSSLGGGLMSGDSLAGNTLASPNTLSSQSSWGNPGGGYQQPQYNSFSRSSRPNTNSYNNQFGQNPLMWMLMSHHFW